MDALRYSPRKWPMHCLDSHLTGAMAPGENPGMRLTTTVTAYGNNPFACPITGSTQAMKVTCSTEAALAVRRPGLAGYQGDALSTVLVGRPGTDPRDQIGCSWPLHVLSIRCGGTQETQKNAAPRGGARRSPGYSMRHACAGARVAPRPGAQHVALFLEHQARKAGFEPKDGFDSGSSAEYSEFCQTGTQSQ